MSHKILIIDDESDIRALLADILEDEGYLCFQGASAGDALRMIQENEFDAVILDIWLEGSDMDGIGVLKKLKSIKPKLPVIMISGHGNIETAVQTIKFGAYDFIEKPFKSEKLLIMLSRAIESYNLARENFELQAEQNDTLQLVGSSKPLRVIESNIKNLSQLNSRVFISGENGTGKELIAKLIHQKSSRNKNRFVLVHGADFLDAKFCDAFFDFNNSHSPVQKANEGTLYIDEISAMPLEMQSRFLTFLQCSQSDMIANIRIIVSSRYTADQLVKKGLLNSTLSYRINVAQIEVPALCERKEDISLLANFFVQFFCKKMGLPLFEISQEVIALLELYRWPGNIRQLKNIIERLIISCASGSKSQITVEDLPHEISTDYSASHNDNHDPLFLSMPLKNARDCFEAEYLKAQLERFSGNVSKTSEFVGMDRAALHRKLKQLKIA